MILFDPLWAVFSLDPKDNLNKKSFPAIQSEHTGTLCVLHVVRLQPTFKCIPVPPNVGPDPYKIKALVL